MQHTPESVGLSEDGMLPAGILRDVVKSSGTSEDAVTPFEMLEGVVRLLGTESGPEIDKW